MNDFLKAIKNTKNELFITGTVTSLDPLTVKLIPTDDSINVVSTSNLLGLRVGSRILILKFQDQLIGIAVIDKPTFRVIELSSAQALSSTTLTNTNITFSFDADSKYHVYLSLSASGDASDGIKLDWNETGTIPSNQVRKTIGQAFGQTDREDTTACMRQSYISTDIEYGCDSSNTIIEDFILYTTTAGTLTLRAAKYADSGGDTTISSNSYAIVQKIGEMS